MSVIVNNIPFDVSSLANPKTKGPVRAIGQKINK